MAKTKTGDYDLRIVILPRVLAPQGPNGEEAESWPDPAPGTREYFAAQVALTAGETIVQGIRQSTGGMKLRIKGRAIPVTAAERVKKKATGEVFDVTGVSRESGDTVLTVERANQSVPQ